MTGIEILAMANLHTEGDAIDASAALGYINEWLLMDLGGAAGIMDSAVITSTVHDEWLDLPQGFIKETEVLKNGKPYWGMYYGREYRGDYDTRNGQIRFPAAGTYTVYYARRPAALKVLEDTPEVNDIFHYCGSLFIAMRHKYFDDEDNKDALRLRAEYDNYREKAVRDYKKLAKSTTRAANTVKARPWV